VVVVANVKPPGVAPIFSRDADSTDDLYRALGGHFDWGRLRELDRTLQRRGMKLLVTDTENLFPDMVTEYLAIKIRQAL